MGKFVDLTGKKFGKLTVISRAENKGKYVAWNCKCDCGNDEMCVVIGNHLKNGHTQSCGCQKIEAAAEVASCRRIDLTGVRFGKLLVLDKVGNDDLGLWRCRCDCTNEIIIKGGYLRNGTKSCGCLHKENTRLIDLVGKRFNNLIVVSRADNIGKETAWNCVCDCGNNLIVLGQNLKNNHTTSCGCKIRSLGEMKISNCLKGFCIDFEEQKRFGDCVDKKPLPFDFYLPDYKVCIEYDGRQHFEVVSFNGDLLRAQAEYELVKRHDAIKTKYCRDNNINLIRISYTEFDDIEKILSEKLS